MTGNGSFDGTRNFGECFLKLSASSLNVLDFFTPFGSMSYVQGQDLTHIDNRRGTFMGNPLTSSRRSHDGDATIGDAAKATRATTASSRRMESHSPACCGPR